MTYPLPSGWQEFKLKDIGFFLRGSGISKKDLSDTGTPAIRYGDIYTKYNFVIKDISSYTNSKGTEIKKGDILFTGSGETAEEIGKSVAFIDDYKALAGGDIIIFRPNIDLNSIFLSYILNFGKCRKDISIMGQGHTVVHIYASSLEILKVILPPLEEQKRIAEVLSLCDDIIENLTELIEKKEQYKKGVMQRLLSGEVRFKGFTDEWKNTTLNEVIKEKTVKNKNNKINLVLSVTNKDGFVIQNEFFGKTIASKDLSNYKIVDKWDFAYNPARVNVGSISMLENFDVCIVSPMYVVFSINHEIIYKYFLKYWIQSHNFNGYIKSLSAGSVRSILSFDAMSTMKIKVPSLEEQKKIAGLLSVIDEEIENLKKQLELRKQQKKGLMQKLLTGEVRV